MRTIMSECVGDGEGVETDELEGKEMEGKKNRCKNRQIEGRRNEKHCLSWADSGSCNAARFEKMKKVKCQPVYTQVAEQGTILNATI